jgi:hypothetical protein
MYQRGWEGTHQAKPEVCTGEVGVHPERRVGGGGHGGAASGVRRVRGHVNESEGDHRQQQQVAGEHSQPPRPSEPQCVEPSAAVAVVRGGGWQRAQLHGTVLSRQPGPREGHRERVVHLQSARGSPRKKNVRHKSCERMTIGKRRLLSYQEEGHLAQCGTVDNSERKPPKAGFAVQSASARDISTYRLRRCFIHLF